MKLGSKLSYKQAADILNEFLPDLSCFNHATTRNRVLAVGRKIEAETRAEIAEKPTVATPADHMIVGIDGTFVKAARTKNQRKNFEKSYSAGSTLGAVRGRFSPRSAISMIWLAKGFAPGSSHRWTWAGHQSYGPLRRRGRHAANGRSVVSGAR